MIVVSSLGLLLHPMATESTDTLDGFDFGDVPEVHGMLASSVFAMNCLHDSLEKNWMFERALQDRYRVLFAGFSDSEVGGRWAEEYGSDFQFHVDALILNFAADLAVDPKEVNQETVRVILEDAFPARLGNRPKAAALLPDLVLDFLLFLCSDVGIAMEWEFRVAVDASRERFLDLMKEDGRGRLMAPKTTPHKRAAGKIGRNDPCPCGSGKKYKKCCARM